MGKPICIVGHRALAPADAHSCDRCPHTVHGPALTGSPDVLINGKPVVRMGDSGEHYGCCGANSWIAVAGSGSVYVNNRPVVRFSDLTQHCGGPGAMVEGCSNLLVGGGMQVSEELRALQMLAQAPGLAGRLAHGLLESRDGPTSLQSVQEAGRFMYGEMMKNLKGSDVAQLRELFRPPGLLESALVPGAALGRAAAGYSQFADLVWPGHVWDHKPILSELTGKPATDWLFDAQSGKYVRTDMWSNIHYGYIGAAVGIPSDNLTTGAAIAQNIPPIKNFIFDDEHPRPKLGGDDERDQRAILLGIRLWQDYGDTMTEQQFMEAVTQELGEECPVF